MLLLLSGVGVLAGPVEPDPDCEFFTETGHNLCEPFQAYWGDNGGLPVFGYPVTEAENEMNLDLGQEFLTQYFERERMEHHPDNAGTPYEVLLGRLGNEVLLEMDRDWTTFPQADPSAEHYFAETGHAIGAEFWEYWSSHGLDLGDDGVSFAESLALFGFPISEPAMETNSSGDTVLTQWFERARFEHHPDNPEEFQVLLGLLGNEILEYRDGGEEPPPPPDGVGEVIAEGLNSPRGIDVTDDGVVFVAEAGIGGEDCITVPGGEGEDDFELCFGTSGQVTQITDSDGLMGVDQSIALDNLTSLDLGGGEAVGPQDVVSVDGALYVIMGLGADPAEREGVGELAGDLGWLISGPAGGSTERVVDVAAYEGEANPDGGDPEMGGIDSNPYSIVVLPDGDWAASDAGANAVLHIDSENEFSTLAVFEDRLVDAPPFLELPEGSQIPMQSVPTGAVVGPDGALYVGELTGFPFVPGMARVWRVTDEGQEVYAEGFTNIIDLAFDGAGNLFVLEMVAGGLLNATEDDPASAASQIVKVEPDGTQTEIDSTGLIFATGMAIGHDGTIYISNFGVLPGMGQVVAIEGVAEPFPSGPEITVLADGLYSPRGIHAGEDGNVYFAEGGETGDVCQDWPVVGEGEEPVEVCFGLTGSINMLTEDGYEEVVSGLSSLFDIRGDILGVQDVYVDAEGVMYAPIGLGADPALRADFPDEAAQLGWIVSASAGESAESIYDLGAYELANNPDEGLPDTNPWSIVSDGEGGWVVSDPGANAVLHIDAEGMITVIAVFADRMVDAPPELGLPEGAQVPMQTVPTGVVMGPDGAFYVGELTGFPFVPGAARIWRIADGSQEIYAEGFTNIVDLAFDSEGNLYALELSAAGLLTEDVTSAVVQVLPDGSQVDVVTSGLTFATGMAIGPDDTFYVSHFGVMQGLGQVVSFSLD